MNKHYILSLFDDSLKTVGVKFKGLGKEYTYKTRLTLEVGDHVVVSTPSEGFAVVEVTSIHDEPQLDANSVTDYKWIVCRVDTSIYDAQNASDEMLYKEIAKAQRNRQRAAAKEALAQQLPGIELLMAKAASKATPSFTNEIPD